MNNFKERIFSDKGMKIINVLFLLSTLIRNRGIIFIAYLAWIAYLLIGIKHTSSKAVKIINTLFILFAAAVIAVNVWAMLTLV